MINIERIKRQAKKLKREAGLTHTQAPDAIAQQHGFKTYTALLASTK